MIFVYELILQVTQHELLSVFLTNKLIKNVYLYYFMENGKN